MSIPRPEYPRPQFERQQWLNLNGQWQFQIDSGDSGKERGLFKVGQDLNSEITVPFCPESTLSGVGHVDFLPAVWYKKRVQVPADWKGQKILLHFGAVDYDATVWINGVEVTRHRGGFTPFVAPISAAASAADEIEICVRARDDHDTPKPRGKQSQLFGNHGCLYTRTTGIWQTVWLEPVGDTHLLRPRITPEVGAGRFRLEQGISGGTPGLTLKATLKDDKGVVAEVSTETGYDFTPRLDLDIAQDRRRLWSTTDPFLYDIEIELSDKDGKVLDSAKSYAGLRGVAIDGKAVRINGEVIFQRLVLDQGYYIDGIMTAPSDQALIDDIELGLKAGFNGARLHQKVFEERFLYHADRLGYLVWGEFGDWGCRVMKVDTNRQHHAVTFAAQWAEALERDYSHPSIIGWCPLNETHEGIRDEITELDDATHAMFLTTKLMDTTRPVLDTSGYSHRVAISDIYDSHDYEQNPEKFHENQKGLADGNPFLNGDPKRPMSIPYNGQPYFVSEFGGIHWKPGAKLIKKSPWEGGEDGENAQVSWGYGASPVTLDEFYARFEGLCDVLLDNPDMFAYCYTQLTDVFQEENGIYAFDRSEKFDMEKIHAIQTKRAAIEIKYEGK